MEDNNKHVINNCSRNVGNYKESIAIHKAVIEIEKDVLEIGKLSALSEEEIYSRLETLSSSTGYVKKFYAMKGRFPNTTEDKFM